MNRKHQAFRLIGLVIANHQLGNTQASDASLAALISNYHDDVPYYIAFAHSHRDELDLAFEWLEKAAELGDPELKTIGLRSPNQEFDNMRNDPRWQQFLERHPPPEVAGIPFEVNLPGS